MKSARIELKITVLVHVGTDVLDNAENMTPERTPDACTTVRLTRHVELGSHIQARDAAPGHFVSLLANTAPVLAERLQHELREKGF